MIQKIVCMVLLLCAGKILAQESAISVVSEVQAKQIRLKWFLKDFDQIQAAVNFGYTIERAEIQGSMKPEMADFVGAMKFTFESKRTSLQRTTLEDTISQADRSVLDAFISKSGVTDKSAKEYAFALFSLQNALSIDLANLVGLSYTDVSFNSSKIYAYRINIKGVEPFYHRVDASQLTVYPKLEGVKLNLDRKKTVDIEWTAKQYTNFGFGYLIEKALDAPKEGNFLTQQPYAPVKTSTEKTGKLDSYRDNDLTEGKFHYYRLTGLNYFGEPAMFSEWLKIYVPNQVHADIFIDTIYAQNKTRIVEGKAVPIDQGPMKIDKWILEKSPDREGNFEKVEETSFSTPAFRFTVPMIGTGDQFYYRVVAVGSDQDSVFSSTEYFFTLDQEPPGAPIMKSGKVDSSGMVKLLWTPPSDKDIKGYRIFRGNALSEEFQEVNKELSPASAYLDQIRLDNLTSEVYYFVRAVDKNFNNSKNSDTLLILKPDTIAPVPAFLYKPVPRDSVLELSWSNSESTDIQQNFLLRQNGNQWDTLYRWLGTISKFTDPSILPGKNYTYQILTLDKSGNIAWGEKRSINFEPGYRVGLKKVTATANREKKCVEITWESPVEKVFSYQIYKQDKNGKFTLIKTLESPEKLVFQDRVVSIGNPYRYYVKYITSTGIHSLPSKEVEVVY